MHPIILALSSFRYSEYAIELSLRLAEKSSNLIICCFTDENIHKYLAEVPFTMREDLKKDLVKKFQAENKIKIEAIREKAKELGIEKIRTINNVGRFADLILDVVKKENPEYVITTRSTRLDFLRKIFGSPVDRIKSEASCQVVEI